MPVQIDATFNVGGQEVYLRCVGGSGPTVVFEAALGEDHTNWLPIAERLTGQAFACAYDRTGVGRSSTPRPAHAASDHARELHELLRVAGVPRPIVIVGHSYGGLVALMAAATNPEEVAGMILVDASHPAQQERFNTVLTSQQTRAIEESVAEMADAVDWHSSLKQAGATYGQLPPIPLTVISSTRLERSDDLPPDYPYEAVRRVWADLQAEHAALRPDARHVLADAGHYVQIDDPDLVVEEILRMVRLLASPLPGAHDS